jgi:hypothetical protein
MINVKCPICKKGNPFQDCCGYEKLTGKKIYTIFDFIKSLIKNK